MTPPARIRSARADDLAALRDVERAAGAAFRDIGMAAVADDEPPSIVDLARFQRDGRAWVATMQADAPIAYLLVDVIDGGAHIEQVSVDPAFARRRLGQALIDTAARWSRRRGMSVLTLTTYADVPWNAPYYERLGFEVLPDQRIGPGLVGIRDEEARRGLANWPRVTMVRAVGRT